jgi:Xaa-Pro aminopeptidase
VGTARVLDRGTVEAEGAVKDVVIFGETSRNAALRRELPLQLTLPGLYVEHDGRRYAFFDALDCVNLEGIAGLEVLPLQALGFDELARTVGARSALVECALRACRETGVRTAAVPVDFPLDVADGLRANGVELVPDAELFALRRRSKTPAQLEGVRRAQRAAEAAMTAVRDGLGQGVRSCVQLQSLAARTIVDEGCASDWLIVSHGVQTATPLDRGSGEIAAGEPVIVDLFPRDLETACYADMTRTFCVGPAPARLLELHRACNEVREALVERLRPGARTLTLAELGCDRLRRLGFRTFLDPRGDEPAQGVLHMFSHGVGLDIIEPPEIKLEDVALVAGDVISLEPALYFPGWGGYRVEDLVHVADTGAEVLTRFPYALEL